MTSHRRKRCISCGVRYSYQASGWGAPKYNHHDYCQECYEVVCEALKKVPRKFKKDLVETEEVTLEQLREWEQAWKDEHEEKVQNGSMFFPYVRRIGVPMYNVETGAVMKNEFVTGRDDFHHRVFNYEYWPGKEDEAVIREEVEVNCETGAIRPWSLSASGRPMPKSFSEKLPESALPPVKEDDSEE